ncbi:hypothetical protein ACOMHN_049017 [Nucella lapillus]
MRSRMSPCSTDRRVDPVPPRRLPHRLAFNWRHRGGLTSHETANNGGRPRHLHALERGSCHRRFRCWSQ